MSFFDTLKSLGLWQPPQGAPAAQQPNPYGLDPAMMKQAQMNSLGNIGSQLLAMSMPLTQQQRAAMMARADFTGGYQNNLYNAAQMKLMGEASQRRQQEQERMDRARALIADRIKAAPAGPAKDAAMYFFEAGDLTKAGEILFKRERRFNPYTVAYEEVDAFGQPIGGASPAPQSGQPAMTPPAAAEPAAVAAPGGEPAPMPQPGATTDPVTERWRALTKDPSLTPQEVQQMVMAAAEKGDPNAAMEVYRQIQQERRLAEKDTADISKQKADVANAIIDDYRVAADEPQKVVRFAQSIEDILASGNPTGMRALATQVLTAKVLDPGSAFMTGEAELQQRAASWSQRMSQFINSTTEGTPISPELVLEMRDIARQLGRRALKQLEKIDRQTQTRAKASGISNDLLGNPFDLRWNRFSDPVVSEGGTGQREPLDQAIDDLNRYGG